MSFIQYQRPIIDFSKVIKGPLYDAYHVEFTEKDIAYRYRCILNKYCLKPVYIIKKKVFFNEDHRFIYDPLTKRKTFLSGSCNKEGEVKNNIVWYREDNDLQALKDFLEYFKDRSLNNQYYDISVEIIISKLQEEIKNRICNHADKNGNLTITYNSGSKECRCWQCGMRFIEIEAKEDYDGIYINRS